MRQYEFQNASIILQAIKKGGEVFGGIDNKKPSSMEYGRRLQYLYIFGMRYVDVQLIISGEEKICVQSLDVMKEGKCLQEYTDESDVELYESNNKGIEHILKSGEYMIIYPEDAHMPGVCVDTPIEVKKAVIKVKVQ